MNALEVATGGPGAMNKAESLKNSMLTPEYGVI